VTVQTTPACASHYVIKVYGGAAPARLENMAREINRTYQGPSRIVSLPPARRTAVADKAGQSSRRPVERRQRDMSASPANGVKVIYKRKRFG